MSLLLLFGFGHQAPCAGGLHAARLAEGSLVSLTEPGLRPLHGCRRCADVDVDLHLLAVGQQLYALSLQLLDAQALYLAKLLHVVHLPFWVAYTTLANLPQGRGGVFAQKG